jgi:hypothetical protein
MDDDSLTAPLCAQPAMAIATSTIATKPNVHLFIDVDFIIHHLMFVNWTTTGVNPPDKEAVTWMTPRQSLLITVCLRMPLSI